MKIGPCGKSTLVPCPFCYEGKEGKGKGGRGEEGRGRRGLGD